MQTSSPATEPSTKFRLWLVGSLLFFTFCMMVLDAFRQGIWIDEIWSLWMSESGVGFQKALHERWLEDAHPPLFHAVNWLLSPLVGESIFSRRLMNIFPAVYLVLILSLVWTKFAAYRNFCLVFAALLLTSRGAIWYFPEHRSYFAILCISGALSALLYAMFRADADLKLKEQRTLAGTLALTILLSLNLHYISVAILGSVLGAAALAQAFRARWGWAALLVASTLVSLVPLLLALWAQLPFLTGMTGNLWIKTTPVEAVGMLVTTPGHTAGDNVVAALATLAVILAAYRQVRGAPPLRVFGKAIAAPDVGTWWFVGVTLVGLAFGSAVLAAASFVQPLLVPRYLIAIIPLTAAVAAALAADLLLSSRLLVILFCLNAAVLVGVYSVKPLTSPRWAATINYVRARVAECPAAVVYGVDTSFSPLSPVKGQLAIQDWGYEEMGRVHGFKVTVLHTERREAPAFSAECPTLLWAEHVDERKAPGRLMNSPMARLPEVRARLSTAKVFRSKLGFVMEVPPHGPAAVAPSAPQPR